MEFKNEQNHKTTKSKTTQIQIGGSGNRQYSDDPNVTQIQISSGALKFVGLSILVVIAVVLSAVYLW